MGTKLVDVYEELSRARIEYASFERLQDMESGAIPRRLEQLKEEVSRLERREREGQSRYKELSEEKESIITRLVQMEEDLLYKQSEAAAMGDE